MMKFIAKYSQIEEKINEWKSMNREYVKFHSIDTFSGYKVHAVVFSKDSDDDSKRLKGTKPVLYFSQPHAHEPATIAGMMDVMQQLVSGTDLMGNKTQLDIEKILSGLIVIFCPSGNPYGVDRAPVLYWDGSQYTNEKFWTIIFGDDPDNPGKMWKRLGQWDTREVNAPDPVGIVYEPVECYTYVEPNRSQLSSYFRMFHKINEKYGIKFWAELHQTEFVGSEYNSMILLPNSEYTPKHINDVNRNWAQKVTESWKSLKNCGFKPCEPYVFSYGGQQEEYFRQNYFAINQKIHRITSEVKNNSSDFPARMQLKANISVIETSIGWVLENYNF